MAEKAQDKPQPSGRPAPAAMRKMASGPVWAAKKSEDRRPRTPEEPLVAAATYPHIAAEPMERERERESETVEVAVDKANSKADEMPGDQMKEAGENSGAVGELDSSDVHAAEASAQQSLELNVPSDAEEVAEMFPVATVALDKANSESDEMPGGQMNEAGENFVALGELDGSDGPQEVAGMDSAATVALDKASWAAVFLPRLHLCWPLLAVCGPCYQRSLPRDAERGRRHVLLRQRRHWLHRVGFPLPGTRSYVDWENRKGGGARFCKLWFVGLCTVRKGKLRQRLDQRSLYPRHAH